MILAFVAALSLVRFIGSTVYLVIYLINVRTQALGPRLIVAGMRIRDWSFRRLSLCPCSVHAACHCTPSPCTIAPYRSPFSRPRCLWRESSVLRVRGRETPCGLRDSLCRISIHRATRPACRLVRVDDHRSRVAPLACARALGPAA